jgi:type III secretion protein Q
VQAADHPHMTEDAVAAETETAAAPTLDELQLPIVFELDTARISLAALADMRPGYAVELDVPLREATVRLVCHGQTLGQGQLVAIGDQLGVRITRMEHPHDAAVAG